MILGLGLGLIGLDLGKIQRLGLRLRIKTSTPVIATEPAEPQAQISIRVTQDNDQEPQEKRRESAEQNNIADGSKAEEPEKDNEGTSAGHKEEEVTEDGGGKNPEDGDEEEDESERAEEAAPAATETKTLAPLANNPVPPATLGPTPRKAPKFKQREARNFKSKPPRKGVLGFGDDIPGMDGLGTDITVICPWEAFSHLELHELAQFGII
ncbi:uncharacterized protein ACNLHF_024909 [Anomaloglossus baeobatrachus]|uniref:uncharacterized protein LOC142246745 n=1 Tax=Anomaloglossus baeobatrachus TaxID=238106 RepID=UPI003F4FCE88